MPKRILVVDDDPVIVRTLEGNLKSSGYEVLVSQDATEGLEKAFKQFPQLIILDVMMPIINGFNFCRLLKSQEQHRGIPIIMLTSRAEEEDRKIGLEVGADAYLVKPFKTEELLARIKDLLKTE